MKYQSDNKAIVNSPGLLQSELAQLLAGFWRKFYCNSVLRRIVRKLLIVAVTIVSVILFFSVFLYIIPGIQEAGPVKIKYASDVESLQNDPSYKKQMQTLNNEVRTLSRKYALYTPGQSYLVINTTDNLFYLYNNKKLVREGFCSSGSYTKLTTVEGSRQWIFKTPKGRFWIQGKMTRPLWIRPDWSFIEEGLPVPAPDDPSRYEYGVLGEYAMSLGDGYLIHGTLYKRFLGMPVTHGCVRLNDEDLEAIYRTLDIGSKVYIF